MVRFLRCVTSMLLLVVLTVQAVFAQLPYTTGDGKPSNIKFSSISPNGMYRTGDAIEIETVFDDWLGGDSDIRVVLNTGDTIKMTFHPKTAEEFIDPTWGIEGKRNATLATGYNSVLCYGVYCILELEGKGGETQNKGKFVLGGGFMDYEELPGGHDMLVVTDKNGQLLQGFGNYNTSSDVDRFEREVRWVIETNDGGLLVSGAFRNYQGNENEDYLVKFVYDSGLEKFVKDETFMSNITNAGVNVTVNGELPYFVDSWGKPQRAVLQDEDGSIYVTGNFNQIAGQTRYQIAKLNSDGTLNETFQFPATSNVFTNGGSTLTFDDDDPDIIWWGARNRVYRLSKTTGMPVVDQNGDGSYDVNDWAPGPNTGILAITILPNSSETDSQGNPGPGGVLVTGRGTPNHSKTNSITNNTNWGWINSGSGLNALQDDLSATPLSKFAPAGVANFGGTPNGALAGWAIDGAAFLKGKMWLGLHDASYQSGYTAPGNNFYEGGLVVLNYNGTLNTEFNHLLANAGELSNVGRPDGNYVTDGIGGYGSSGGTDIISLYVTEDDKLMVRGSYGSMMQYTDNAYCTSTASNANPDDQIITRISFNRATGEYVVSEDDILSELKVVSIIDHTVKGAFGDPAGTISMDNIIAGDEFENNHFISINMPFTPDEAQFITTWQTTTANETITIPTNSATAGYDFIVDWGITKDEDGDGMPDGNIPVMSRHTTANMLTNPPTYTYPVAGTYTIKIMCGIDADADGVSDGTGFPSIYFNNQGDKDKLLSIEQWGDVRWESMRNAFYGCSNLTYNAEDVPDLSLISDMAYMFAYCSSFNGAIGNWDLSNVTILRGVFLHATQFNQPLNDWDVAHVTDMRFLFSNASAFNQDLSNWQVSAVEDMSYVFDNAKAFNGNIDDWNVSSVTTMRTMFQRADSFSRDISSWDVSNVKDMQFMFFRATAFDHNLGRWDISSLETAAYMLDRSGLGIVNYDTTLISWANQVDAATASEEVKFSAAEINFCAGADARDALMQAGWGDGLIGIQNNNGINSNGTNDDITDGGSGRPVDTFVFNDDFSVCIGNNAAINLSGSEVGVYYQLYNKANDLAVGDSIPGTGTSISFTINITETNTNTYYVIATNYTIGACETRLSDEITVTVDQLSKGGTLSADATNVCNGTNIIKLFLIDDYYGDIIRWESSLDNFVTNRVEISHTEPTYVVSNLTVTTAYRAVIQSGSCEEAFSTVVTVIVDPASVGGRISTDVETLCSGNSYTVLRLNDYVGDVVRWQISHDNFTSWSSYAVTTDSLEVQNITKTTYYRAQTQSGVCSMAYSDTIKLTVDPVSQGGFITPSDTAIYYGDQLSLELEGETGSILRWESSTDNFTTATEINNIDNSYLTPVINDSIYYRALVQSGVCDSAYSSSTLVYIIHSDYGDAPDSYGTMRSSNGPEHRPISVSSNIYIGNFAPDFEIDGQPSAVAGLGGSSGDDGNISNDEDGLDFSFATNRSDIILDSIKVTNNNNQSGYLYGWIDINQDGSFDDGERAMKSIVANSTANLSLSFTGFNYQIEPGNYFVRLRVGSEEAEISQPTGLAADGEVEDHMICIHPDKILLGDARIDVCSNAGAINLNDCINYVPQIDKTVEWTTHDGNSMTSAMVNTDSLPLANVQLYYYNVTEEYCDGINVFGEGKVLLKVKDEVSLEDRIIKVCYDDSWHINLFNYLGYIGTGTWSYMSEESSHSSIDAKALNGHIFNASMDYSGSGTDSFVFKYTPASDECVTSSAKVTVNVVNGF